MFKSFVQVALAIVLSLQVLYLIFLYIYEIRVLKNKTDEEAIDCMRNRASKSRQCENIMTYASSELKRLSNNLFVNSKHYKIVLTITTCIVVTMSFPSLFQSGNNHLILLLIDICLIIGASTVWLLSCISANKCAIFKRYLGEDNDIPDVP